MGPLPGRPDTADCKRISIGLDGRRQGGRFGSQTTPPVFLFASEGAFAGENGDGLMGHVGFYGSPASLTSPDGNNFIAADGDPSWGGSISQTVSGLMVGDTYSLQFNWAGAEQQGFSGNTTEDCQVTFGSSTLSTDQVSTPSQTCVGWQTANLTFTATSASQ